MISKAWFAAATPSNAISGFRGSGIFPVNPHAISDYDIAIAEGIREMNINQQNSGEVPGPSNIIDRTSSPSILSQDVIDRTSSPSILSQDVNAVELQSPHQCKEKPSTSKKNDISIQKASTSNTGVTVSHVTYPDSDEDATDAEEYIENLKRTQHSTPPKTDDIISPTDVSKNVTRPKKPKPQNLFCSFKISCATFTGA